MEDSRPTVSALIVNRNGGDFLAAAVESLQRQTRPPDEIIVVDNASTDRSIAALHARCEGVILIRAESNLGFAGGVNLAAANARGQYFALLNSDAVAEPRWLEELVAVFSRDATIAAAQGKVCLPESPRRIEQAGAEFNNLANYWGRGYYELDASQYDEESDVPGVTACAMLLRRAALNGEVPFDEELFMYGEELDLTIRLRRGGHRIVYTPRAVVIHSGMQSVQRTTDNPRLFQQFHSNRNRVKLLAKYFPARSLLRSLPLVLAGIIYVDVMIFLRRGGLRYAVRAVRAQWQSALLGLRQRRTRPGLDTRWMAWMKSDRLRDVRRRMKQLSQGDQPVMRTAREMPGV